MDKKEQDIATEETGVVSEESTLDLRAIRKSKGLTLKDMSSSTRISYQNLKAIEEQTFELLPEPIYARAFIDMYARVLDVDVKKILPLYDTYLKSLEPDEDKYAVLRRLTVKKRNLQFWISVVIVLGVMALVGFFYLYQAGTDHDQPKEAAGKEIVAPPVRFQNAPGEILVPGDGDVVERKPPETGGAPLAVLFVESSLQETDQAITEDARPVIEGDQPREAVGPDTTVPAEENPYTLAVEASELTWIQIAKDGKPSFEIMLRPGEQFTERASEKFGLLIGNAGGVDIRFQGRSLGPLGKHGEVILLTLPTDG
ncbi:MAG: DUF4115 domain-containing protein [Syntrophales bacterium]|nr:DUF4115 domain-containing protein [Syntrophales bacterium]